MGRGRETGEGLRKICRRKEGGRKEVAWQLKVVGVKEGGECECMDTGYYLCM